MTEIWGRAIRLGFLAVFLGAGFICSSAKVVAQYALTPNEITVSRQGPYYSLRTAIEVAGPGGTIRLKEGRYAANDLAIPYDLTIIGEGNVLITSTRPVAKGFLVPQRGVALEVRGLTFQNAKSPDQNGAGIRFEGRELIVIGCTFITNENGILATGADASEVTISNSRFFGNGFGDGRSHGIYMSRGAALAIEGSTFESTRIGHHVKSIATQRTLIRNNKFDDGNGMTSYMVDVTGGGDMLIEKNYVVRRRNAEQETLFNYDTSRRGQKGRITFTDNQITNEKQSARLLRNPEDAPVYLTRNSFDNLNGGTMALPVSTPGIYDASRYSPYPVVPAGETAEATRAPADLTGLTPVQRKSVEQLIDKGLIPVRADEVPVNAEFAEALARQAQLGAQEQARSAPPQTQAQRTPSTPAVATSEARALEVRAAEARATEAMVPQVRAPVARSQAGRPETGRRETGQQVVSPAPTRQAPISAQTTFPNSPAISTNTSPRAKQGIVTVPLFLSRQRKEELVAVNLLAKEGARETSPIVTFGQAFSRRLLKPKEALGLRIGKTMYPVQMDVKAMHGDGSVRHGVLTVDLTGLAKSGGRNVQGMLVNLGEQVPATSLKRDDAFDLTVSIKGEYADGMAFSGEVNLAPLITEAIATGRVWLMGPYALETTVVEDIGKFLTLRADIRMLSDKSIRTRLIFENHKSFVPGNREMTYDLVVSAKGRQLFQRSAIQHYRGANWSEIVWRGRQPGWRVQFDPAQLIAAGATPQFDLNYGISQAVITANAQELATNRTLFSNGLLTKYFPTTGGREDIGLLPGWDINWLKSQSPLAYENMVGMAERAGAVPWHFEDDATEAPVRLDQRPNFWAVSDGADIKYAPDNLPRSYFEGSNGGWTLDNAHKPLLSYTPYLVTGDAYYARELAHEAAFSLARIWPGLREGEPLVTEAIQVRSRAWALRDVAGASWLLPDNAPLKDYFTQTLELNLSHLLETYVLGGRMDLAGETEGWFAESVNGDPGRISPWQNDYLVMVLALEALRGSPIAAEILSWAANYHKGRFLNDVADPALGAATVHIAKNAQTQAPLGRWASVMSATKGRADAAENYAGYGAGYVASAYGALAGLYSATGDAQLLEAMKALYDAQPNQALFDPANEGSIYAVPSFLMTARGQNGVEKSVTDLVRVPQ